MLLNTVHGLKAATRTALATLTPPKPEFTFRIGWASNYESLFLERFEPITGIDSLFTTAQKDGRLILHGRGGGAKTVILQRLWERTLRAPDVVGILLDLKFWTPEDYSTWADLHSPRARVDLLFTRFASPPVMTAALDELPPEVTRLLLVDSLNEISSVAAQQLLTALDSYVRLALRTRLIVADRLTRREFTSPGRWRLAFVLPVDEPQIRAAIRKEFRSAASFDAAPATTRALLTSPYYLNAALRDHKLPSISSDLHRQYFESHASLTPAELATLSKAAFHAYLHNRSRVFGLAAFTQQIGSGTLDKLLSSGALVRVDGLGYFSHHLKHDYLAAHHIARLPETEWAYRSFTAVTLYASSFDVLAMALELIDNLPKADLFIRKVYDWNLYGAAYAVAETRHNAIQAVSAEMEVILLAMLAERKWDLIDSTGRRSRDALSLFPTDHAKRLLDAPQPRDMFDIVNAIESDKEIFLSWRRLFTLGPDAEAEDDLLGLLEDANSLLGWTAANVLKRIHVAPNRLAALRDRLLGPAPPQIQWRVVHVFGAYPSEDLATTLFAVLEERERKDLWVRYGAIRSLLEMAARADSHLRAFIFDELSSRVSLLADDERIIQEFKNAIFVRTDLAPTDWRARVLGILGVWKAKDVSAERYQDWERLELQVRLAYKANE